MASYDTECSPDRTDTVYILWWRGDDQESSRWSCMSQCVYKMLEVSKSGISLQYHI